MGKITYSNTISAGLATLLFVVAVFALSSQTAHAAAASTINYQGKLFNASSSPVTDGTYSIVFKLYNVSTGGSAFWTETQSVTTQGGLFTVKLGSITTFGSLDWNQPLFLGLTVDTDSEMTPRHTIGSVPAAKTIDGILGVAQGGSGTSTLFTSGAVLFAGANGTYAGNANQLFVSTTTGNIGIGTSTPEAKLHLNAGDILIANNQFLRSKNSIGSNGNLIGRTTSDELIIGDVSFSNPIRIQTGINYITFEASSTERMRITADGNIGIGTSSPSAQFHTTGSVRFQNFGSGSLSTDASGNLTVSSDERLKDVTGKFETGLAAIRGLEPIRYHWNATSGLDQVVMYAGFSAQNVMDHIEDAVGVDSRGYFTLNDRPIIAATVNAIKELDISIESLASSTAAMENENGEKTFVGRFFTRIVSWFADTANGIGNLFATSFRAKDTLCINDTCVGEEKLKELLGTQGSTTTTTQTSGGTSSDNTTATSTATTTATTTPDTTATSTATSTDTTASSTATTTPDTIAPTITLTGDASITITVGDTYAEPGATATDNIDTSLTVTQGGDTVNTATAGTYTITYNTTDTAGNAATQLTRTVTVQPAPTPPTCTPPQILNPDQTACVDPSPQ